MTETHTDSASRPDFRRLPDLAGQVLGGAVVYANDEFYADSHNLIVPYAAAARSELSPAEARSTTVGRRGAAATPGEDFVIVRLARPAVVRGVNIDTTHFRGNYPPAASLEAVLLLGYPTAGRTAGRARGRR